MKNEHLTGRFQKCILKDGKARSTQIVKILVDFQNIKGRIEALCMSKPIYFLILCYILGVRKPYNWDVNWYMENLEKVRFNFDNKEVSCRQERLVCKSYDKAVTRDDHNRNLTEPSDTFKRR